MVLHGMDARTVPFCLGPSSLFNTASFLGILSGNWIG
jgi:hypothetical protein